MEYGWERTFPFLDIDINKIIKLFEGILEENNIANIIPINEGCRTTNYVVRTNKENSKYILKIFLSGEQDHKKEIKLLSELEDNRFVHAPKIHKFGTHEIIQGREYAIYQYIEGKTIGQSIKDGYKLEANLVKQVARALSQIHSYKFSKAGYLDENLNIKRELSLIELLYKKLMGDRVKKRLGINIINKINYVVKENEENLAKLDEEIRLIHGDFQGTNILIKDGKLSGILDWEFASAGYPLSDIGQFFRYEEYFNKDLILIFEEEYNKNSSYKLANGWYKISKLCDLVNLLKLVDTAEDMPNKHKNIRSIISNNLEQF